jgi:ubiquitin-like-conjugating enzyme ATG3
MKTILANLTHSKDGAPDPAPPQVETYLFIFLKFVSSIIPTINYDFTMDVKASTAKN